MACRVTLMLADDKVFLMPDKAIVALQWYAEGCEGRIDVVVELCLRMPFMQSVAGRALTAYTVYDTLMRDFYTPTASEQEYAERMWRGELEYVEACYGSMVALPHYSAIRDVKLHAYSPLPAIYAYFYMYAEHAGEAETALAMLKAGEVVRRLGGEEEPTRQAARAYLRCRLCHTHKTVVTHPRLKRLLDTVLGWRAQKLPFYPLKDVKEYCKECTAKDPGFVELREA